MKITDKYFVECSQIKNRKGCWNSTKVEIFRCEDCGKKKIGEYIRNYGSFGAKTFYPFRQDDKEFALISDNYTRTKVISLPYCKDVAEEPIDGFGFCPVEFYIPNDDDEDVWAEVAELNGQFGFVSGCVWGDDSSWKIRFLDLSNIQNGVIENDYRFGYIELPDDMSLREAISLDEYDEEDQLVSIACRKTFDINERCDEA